MTRWTRELTNQAAAAFNSGDSLQIIALRLDTTPKAVSAALCRARKGKHGRPGIFVQRRSGTPKRGDDETL
jgi:hypothetical protein